MWEVPQEARAFLSTGDIHDEDSNDRDTSKIRAAQDRGLKVFEVASVPFCLRRCGYYDLNTYDYKDLWWGLAWQFAPCLSGHSEMKLYYSSGSLTTASRARQQRVLQRRAESAILAACDPGRPALDAVRRSGHQAPDAGNHLRSQSGHGQRDVHVELHAAGASTRVSFAA